MKRIFQVTMTMVLLMTAALTVSAQTTKSASGTLRTKFHGKTVSFTYNISGTNHVTKKQANEQNTRVYYGGQVRRGASLVLSGSVKGEVSGAVQFTYKIYGKSGKEINSSDEFVGLSGSRLVLVPYNAERVECIVNAGSMFWAQVDLHCTSEQPLGVVPIECNSTRVRHNTGLKVLEAMDYKDCGVRFRDITGDVSVRACDDDDDQWESAEFDTILHYRDYIKTEVDSEAILGLADKTSFVIKEKSILIMPEYEGDVSNIKMIAGVIWVNMKKMVNGGELRLDGTQAVAGIRGTIVAMEETGAETRFWLFSGKVQVTSRATGKQAMLEPGQMSVTRKDGKVTVKKFDIKSAAKKFGIPMSDIENHGLTFTERQLQYRVLSAKTVEVIGEKPGTATTSLTIPTTVKYNGTEYNVVGIGKKAFANRTGLSQITIARTVRAIAEDAFLNTGLKHVYIYSDKVSVVKNAFRDCKNLIYVTISGKEPQCSPDAFNGCSAMKELRIKGISESNNGKKLNGTNAVIKVIK